MQLTLQKSDSYIGLFPNQSVKEWIVDLVNGFKQKIETDYGMRSEISSLSVLLVAWRMSVAIL